MINLIYNVSLTLARLYLFIKGIGFLLTGDTVTGIGHILIAGMMGVLSMPWPKIPDPDDIQANKSKDD